MRDARPELDGDGRIGVNTGEVRTGSEERLATGDAVNVAARLEQAAEPGEVLIGAQTLALVTAAVEVGEDRAEGLGALGGVRGELRADLARLHAREHGVLLDALQVIGHPVHGGVGGAAELREVAHDQPPDLTAGSSASHTMRLSSPMSTSAALSTGFQLWSSFPVVKTQST